MKVFNRRHPRGPSYSPSSISVANDLIAHHSMTVGSLLATMLDLHPNLVGCDLSDTQERVSRYAAKFLAREASDRLTTSENEQDRIVLHHYLNSKD